jgi:hypothetical protein
VRSTEVARHQQAWLPEGEAHQPHHSEPGRATWRCARTTGCGKWAKVHPVEVLQPACSHGQHPDHHLDDDGRHGPPTPLGPEGGGPRRDDDGGGGADERGVVAARAVDEDEDPGAEVDLYPDGRPRVSSSKTRSSRT